MGREGPFLEESDDEQEPSEQGQGEKHPDKVNTKSSFFNELIALMRKHATDPDMFPSLTAVLPAYHGAAVEQDWDQRCLNFIAARPELDRLIKRLPAPNIPIQVDRTGRAVVLDLANIDHDMDHEDREDRHQSAREKSRQLRMQTLARKDQGGHEKRRRAGESSADGADQTQSDPSKAARVSEPGGTGSVAAASSTLRPIARPTTGRPGGGSLSVASNKPSPGGTAHPAAPATQSQAPEPAESVRGAIGGDKNTADEGAEANPATARDQGLPSASQPEGGTEVPKGPSRSGGDPFARLVAFLSTFRSKSRPENERPPTLDDGAPQGGASSTDQAPGTGTQDIVMSEENTAGVQGQSTSAETTQDQERWRRMESDKASGVIVPESAWDSQMTPAQAPQAPAPSGPKKPASGDDSLTAAKASPVGTSGSSSTGSTKQQEQQSKDEDMNGSGSERSDRPPVNTQASRPPISDAGRESKGSHRRTDKGNVGQGDEDEEDGDEEDEHMEDEHMEDEDEDGADEGGDSKKDKGKGRLEPEDSDAIEWPPTDSENVSTAATNVTPGSPPRPAATGMAIEPLYAFEAVKLLLLGKTGKPQPTEPSRATMTALGLQCPQQPEVQAAFTNLVHQAIWQSHETARHSSDRTSKHGLDFGDVEGIMLHEEGLSSRFTESAYAEQVGWLAGMANGLRQNRFMVNMLEAFYPVIIEKRAREIVTGDMTMKAAEALVGRELYQEASLSKEDRSSTGSGSDEWYAHRRCWQVQHQLWEKGHRVILGLLTATERRLIRRGALTFEHLDSWADFIRDIYRQQVGHRRSRSDGDYRGLDELPRGLTDGRSESVRDRLRDTWSVTVGRWRSATDALAFYDRYGAPSVSHTLLATETLFDHGYLGHHQLAGSDQTMLAAVGPPGEMRWRAIVLTGQKEGAFLGVCPHVMSRPSYSRAYPGDHIAGAYDGIEYDPSVIVGTLSFVRYSARGANARMVLDVHCDTALPDLYSLRVLVFATKPISPLAEIVVKVQDDWAAGRLNEAMEQRQWHPPPTLPSPQPFPDSRVHDVVDLWSLLLANTRRGRMPAELDADLLWAQQLAKNGRDLVGFTPEQAEALRPLIQPSTEVLEDALTFPWVRDHSDVFASVQEAVGRLDHWNIPMETMNVFKSAIISEKVVSMPRRTKKTTRVNRAWQKFRPIGSPERPVTVPTDLRTAPGRGAASAALYVLFGIVPLRTLLCGGWQGLFVSPRARLELRRQHDEVALSYLGLLDAITDALTCMSVPSVDSAVAPRVLATLSGRLDEVEGRRGLEPASTPLTKRGDAHEILVTMLDVLTDCLRRRPLHGERETEAEGEPTTMAAKMRSAWDEHDARAGLPYLFGRTIGMCVSAPADGTLPERDETAPPATHLISHLILPMPPQETASADLVDLLEQYFSPSDQSTWWKLAVLPQYLVVVVPRALVGGQKHMTRIMLPPGMAVEVDAFVMEWRDMPPAHEHINLGMTYNIVATVHHCAAVPTDVTTTTNYLTHVKTGEHWYHYSGDISGRSELATVQAEGSTLCMLLLEQVRE